MDTFSHFIVLNEEMEKNGAQWAASGIAAEMNWTLWMNVNEMHLEQLKNQVPEMEHSSSIS